MDTGAYRALCAGVTGKVDAILDELASATRAAQGYFESKTPPVYYLNQEEQ